MIGAVTRAAALPFTQARTLASIAAMTPGAFFTSARPGSGTAVCPVSMTASCNSRVPMFESSAARANTSALPTRRIERPSIVPPSADHALTAISGPMPEGSPMLTRMGSALSPSARFDNGVAPQLGKIALGEDRHLLDEKLLLDLVAR